MGGTVKDVQSEQELDTLVRSGAPVILHFWASWCEASKHMDQVFSISPPISFTPISSGLRLKNSLRFLRLIRFPLCPFLPSPRFVSILDVASLKPDGDKSAYFSQDADGSILAKKNEASSSPSKSFSPNEKDSACETSHRSSCKRSNAESKDSASANESSNKQPCPLVFELKHDSSGACHTQISQGPKRKGDIEFSLQMEMAISATAAGIANIADGKMGSSMGNPNSNLPNFISPFKRMKNVLSEGSSSSHGISTAIGSRRVGSPQMLPDAVLAPKSLMLFKEEDVSFGSFYISTDEEVRQGLKVFSNWPTFPQLY